MKARSSTHPARSLVMGYLGVAAAVIAVIAGSWLLRPGDEPEVAKTAANATTSKASAGAVLPAPGSYVEGHPVAFPRTELGAVATQVGVTRAQIGFDYDTAHRTARIYSAPEDRGYFDTRARSAVEQRRTQAGMKATGKASAPAAYAASPVAFATERLGDDFYAVHLLSYVTLTNLSGDSADGLYSGTQLLRWAEGDWKVTRGTPAELEQLRRGGRPPTAAPGTPEFADAGWTLIEEEAS